MNERQSSLAQPDGGSEGLNSVLLKIQQVNDKGFVLLERMAAVINPANF
jgi:hypothetical protein